MPLYFAYGANLDRAAMAQRCPGSQPLGLAALEAHAFFVMNVGYASVRAERGSTVHGLLWDLAAADQPALDAYEEVEAGLYVTAVRPVRTPRGVARALVYEGCSRTPGRPAPGYMEGVVAAAAACGLPLPYRDELRGWLCAVS